MRIEGMCVNKAIPVTCASDGLKTGRVREREREGEGVREGRKGGWVRRERLCV